ncbi:alpha/beta fold hydrolase [Microbacterium sp. 179-I 3D2 NHS]|uniref:alpha/beta fold hydrolase n=1 Tax=Microbacterium sp. 179-I 3D2 NHS TaxID=3235178 RepID=UPI0039A06C08
MTSSPSVIRRPGVGRPVVFLHGFASSGAQDWPDAEWAAVLDGRPRLIVDLPGHGGSASPGITTTSAVVDALADAIAEAVAAATADAGAAVGGEGGGVAEIDLVGYSLGARLAWDLAQHPLLRVRRLVLGGLSAAEPFAFVDVAAAREALRGGAAPADPLTAMILQLASVPGNRPDALLDLVEGMATAPFDPQSRPPAVPTLLIGGADDDMFDGADRLVGLLADGRGLRVSGDHRSALHGADFRAAVRDFVSD